MWLGALSKSRILSRTLTLVQGSFFCDLVLIYFIKKSNCSPEPDSASLAEAITGHGQERRFPGLALPLSP